MEKRKSFSYTINDVVTTLYYIDAQKNLSLSDVYFDKKYSVELATSCMGYFSGLPVYRNNPSEALKEDVQIYSFSLEGVSLSVHKPLRDLLAKEVKGALKMFGNDEWFTHFDAKFADEIPKHVDLDGYLSRHLPSGIQYEHIDVLFVNKHRAIVKLPDNIVVDSWEKLR